ncbi:MAG: YggS family pyridoxal phosphate-dependent enzyme [Bacteroidia bacterium]|nr:YggS family pyridoxal phosphate-dependent enzyme [Bacteroidia bacterium]
MNSIQENINKIKQNIPNYVTIIAVSKFQPIEKIQSAYDAGHRDFGENYVQEMVDKYQVLPKDIHWHFIGHLQTNKVKYIVPFVHLIHSVDSLKLLKEINKQAEKNQRVVSCLLQIHIAEEETKFGLSSQEALDILSSEELKSFQFIKIKGLMGMATNTDNTEQIKKEFLSLKSIFDQFKNTLHLPNVQFEILSMGMSNDYPIAIECGSNAIRIGTLIFGERPTKN